MTTIQTPNEFSSYLKTKYKNILQEIRIEQCTDEHGEFIQLVLIKIKRSQRLKGYGSAVLSEITGFADNHNIRIKLWATDIYGSDLRRLYGFYQKHGFVFIKEKNMGEMRYYPLKKKNIEILQ